jgi:hypothetical protein
VAAPEEWVIDEYSSNSQVCLAIEPDNHRAVEWSSVRVYHFTKAKWALQAIHNKRLRISRFFEMNDPFELFAVDQPDQGARKGLREWSARVSEEQGVICFTGAWHDPLMWSNYGDRHGGVCLGFEVCDCDLEKINYSLQRLASGPPQDLGHLLLTTKFSRWKYENELRVLARLSEMIQKGEHYFKAFDNRLQLVEVIAGPRCCRGWQGPLADVACGLPEKPKLIKARLSFRRFKVVTQLWHGSAAQGYDRDSLWQECRCHPRDHDAGENSKLLSA